MKKILLSTVYLLCFFYSTAQEGLFSQPFQSGLLTNPALIGNTEVKTRIGGVFRTQWKIEEAPYQNYGAYFESKLNNFKFGLILNQSKTGDVGFKKTSFLLASGLSKKLGRGNNKISFGAQFGLYQMNVDYVKLQFDNQYNPAIGFDATLGTGEEFEATNLIQPDINIGLTADFEMPTKSKIEGQIGLSIIHINTPGRTFNKEEVLLPMSMIMHAKLRIHLKENWAIEPLFMRYQHDLDHETRLGLNTQFRLITNQLLRLGLANNFGNKLTFLAQFELRKFAIGMSMDANFSNTNQFSTDNNVFELNMIYNIIKTGPKVHYKDVL